MNAGALLSDDDESGLSVCFRSCGRGVSKTAKRVRFAMDSKSGALKLMHRFVPRLDLANHKGSCGRIAVVGGSLDYCGAPYFAGMAALRCGADLAYVICPPDAATAIKAYSPDLCVRPLFSIADASHCAVLVASCHAVVIGPGIGDRDPEVVAAVLPAVIAAAARAKIPIIIDTNVMSQRCVREAVAISKPETLVLTPNIREVANLVYVVSQGAMSVGGDGDDLATLQRIADLVRATLLVKGDADLVFTPTDASPPSPSGNSPVGEGARGGEGFSASLRMSSFVSPTLKASALLTKNASSPLADAGHAWSAQHQQQAVQPIALTVLQDGTTPCPRRAAGQGDIVAGVVGCFAMWASMAAKAGVVTDPEIAIPLCTAAVVLASLTVRTAAQLAFDAEGRSMVASDVLKCVGDAFERVEDASEAVVSSTATSHVLES